ncbi:hypothetical protein GOP47_0023568 [Adiantum capillus-veneris]|uniref:tRNA-5-taurinomethyluridine 2-sulfurtransferase n=1 Tax=Adiantum capillus-veneris TaxID=13818 RepID=A0A9D4U3X9_ADICA|nr:hypothetical protein GOP47_0023568 [Adiantum capillus-veneris]
MKGDTFGVAVQSAPSLVAHIPRDLRLAHISRWHADLCPIVGECVPRWKAAHSDNSSLGIQNLQLTPILLAIFTLDEAVLENLHVMSEETMLLKGVIFSACHRRCDINFSRTNISTTIIIITISIAVSSNSNRLSTDFNVFDSIGGVDSSVALRLLLAAGHSCTAFYLKIWFQEDFENFWSSCPWDEDLKYAQAVCDEAGVELQVVQMTDDYWKHVVSHMIQEYQAGRTPNPDVLCNSRIKFGVFLEHVKDLGFDRVASGHYAKVVRKRRESQAVLHLSEDEVKDQTYFLSHLSQSQLSRLIFPLGCVSKGQVRHIAELLELPNKQRKDSQGICFLGKVKFSDFIARHLGEREGRILEAETGTYLGNHKGYWFYTIGQRQGLRLSHGPWYVVDKDQENNVVFVSKEYYSGEKRRREFEVHAFKWLDGELPDDLSGLRCKVRHGPRFYECSLSFQNSQALKDTAVVRLSDDDQGIAAGQYAAFYRGDVCLGSGVISEFRSDRSSAVSVEAREAAKMKELPASSLSKSKQKKLASLQKKSVTEMGKETRDASNQETLGWLPKLLTLVEKWFSWMKSR